MKTTLKALVVVGTLCIGLMTAPSAKAVIIDLTSPATVGFDTANGPALFSTDFTQATGSGTFEAFLRVQSESTTQGYNTSASNVFNNKDGTHTRNVQMSELKVVSNVFGDFYSFVIDINESNSASPTDKPITLNALKIFTGAPGLNTTNVESLGSKRFDLDRDANGNFVDSEIRYIDGNSGSGQSDIAFLIPVSAFAGANPTDYFILYAQFGVNSDPTNFNGVTNGGFEEFNIAPGIIVNIPEPTAFVPLACVLGAVIGSHRLRRRRA